MLFIQKNSLDPWFNIAADEFILKHIREDTCTIWRSNPCVVIGKHQHTLSEINWPYLEQYNVPVIRRISGGGTVYHDQNCLNYSFITNSKDESDKINFELHTRPVRNFLQSVGIGAKLTGKSNITVDGLKISGNAAHLFKNRSIHHGTLLFDTDLEKLEACIRPTEAAYSSKAVQSNRAVVVNIASLLPEKQSIDQFESGLVQFLKNAFGTTNARGFNSDEISAIEQLAIEKYKSWAWNYGYSPDYRFERNIELNQHEHQLIITVKKGQISNIDFDQTQSREHLHLLTILLAGAEHSFAGIRKALSAYKTTFATNEVSFNQFINQLI